MKNMKQVVRRVEDKLQFQVWSQVMYKISDHISRPVSDHINHVLDRAHCEVLTGLREVVRYEIQDN